MIDLSQIRVLALLADDELAAEFEPFDSTICSTVEAFEQWLDNSQADVVVFDATLGRGWPADVVTAVTERAGQRSAIVLLFGTTNDLLIVDERISARDIWSLGRSELQQGELAAIIAGLATLRRARARSRTGNRPF